MGDCLCIVFVPARLFISVTVVVHLLFSLVYFVFSSSIKMMHSHHAALWSASYYDRDNLAVLMNYDILLMLKCGYCKYKCAICSIFDPIPILAAIVRGDG